MKFIIDTFHGHHILQTTTLNLPAFPVMRSLLRKYLFREATLFPWFMVLLCIAMLYYVVIGVLILLENPEGIMAFLIIPYLVPYAVILGALDYGFRRLFKDHLRTIWMLETALFLVFSAFYYHQHLYRTRFITASVTPLAILVEDPKTGIEPKRGIIQLKTVFNVPPDNILVLKSLLKENEWVHITAKTTAGHDYWQIYPMRYIDKDTMYCGGYSYHIQLFILESEEYPRFRIDGRQFDSMRIAVCQKLQYMSSQSLNQGK